MKNSIMIKGECLTIMDRLIDGGITVDAIITDPPYGTTACKWDSVIPFNEMWKRLNRLIKPKRAIVLFGSEPFSSALRMSNIKNYKYDWTWKKEKGTGFMIAKYRPLIETENIMVFCNKNKSPLYNPQMIPLNKPRIERYASTASDVYGQTKLKKDTRVVTHRYPKSIIEAKRDRGLHPTQKPIKLMEYLVRTYTNEGDMVLDFTAGSGSTGIACMNTGRKFIGIEMDEKYYKIAKERIDKILL